MTYNWISPGVPKILMRGSATMLIALNPLLRDSFMQIHLQLQIFLTVPNFGCPVIAVGEIFCQQMGGDDPHHLWRSFVVDEDKFLKTKLGLLICCPLKFFGPKFQNPIRDVLLGDQSETQELFISYISKSLAYRLSSFRERTALYNEKGKKRINVKFKVLRRFF